MATFDATRPIVAAMALGVGRAALDFVRDFLKQHNIPVRYGISPHKLIAIERDFMDMEVNLKAARLLTWRAAWMLDNGQHNNLEASMAKAKAGLAVTHITQKAVEVMGPLGYSRRELVEKWMRDAKINDIFEGTQQINMLIVARRILGYEQQGIELTRPAEPFEKPASDACAPCGLLAALVRVLRSRPVINTLTALWFGSSLFEVRLGRLCIRRRELHRHERGLARIEREVARFHIHVKRSLQIVNCSVQHTRPPLVTANVLVGVCAIGTSPKRSDLPDGNEEPKAKTPRGAGCV